MATDDIVDFDDDDFLNDMDEGDEWDGLGDSVPDNRKPISRIGLGAIDEILTDTSIRTVGKAIKKNALPKAYGDAIDLGDSALAAGADLVDKVTKELSPAKEAVQDLISSNNDRIDKLLPQWAATKLKSLGEKEESYRQDYVDPVETAIQSASNSIFNREADKTTLNYQIASDEIQSVKETVRDKISTGLLQTIAGGVNKLVSYQNSVLIDYQRKSLELQHRQFFAARDLLELTRASTDVSKELLKGILKNSSLPDAVKLRLDENYRQSLQDSIVGKLRETSGEFVSRFTGKLGEKVKTKVSEVATGLGDAVQQGVDSIVMGQDAAASIEEAGGDRLAMAGGMLGGAGIGWLANRAAKWVGKRIENDPRLLDGSANLQYLMENYPALLSDWARSDKGINVGGLAENIPGYDKLISWLSQYRSQPIVSTAFGEELISGKALRSGTLTDSLTGNTVRDIKDITGAVVDKDNNEVLSENAFNQGIETKAQNADGEGGVISDFIKDLIPQMETQRDVVANLQSVAMETAGMDQLTRRSVIEVIPGYLSRILEQVTNIAVGSPTDRVVYSTETERFTTTAEMDQRLTERLFDKTVMEDRRVKAGELVDNMDKEGTLSDNARNALIDDLLENRDRANGGVFNLNDLRDSTRFDDALVGSEISNLINQQYKPEESNIRSQQQLSRQFKSLGTEGNVIDTAIADYTRSGEKEALRRIGIIGTDREGKDTVDDALIGERLIRGLTPAEAVSETVAPIFNPSVIAEADPVSPTVVAPVDTRGIIEDLSRQFTDLKAGESAWRVRLVEKEMEVVPDSPKSPDEPTSPSTPLKVSVVSMPTVMDETPVDLAAEAINTSSTITHELLTGIITAVQGQGVNLNSQAESAVTESDSPGLLSKGLGLVGQAGKATASGLAAYYKGLFNVSKGGLGLAGKAVSGTFDLLTSSKPTLETVASDVYVKGDKAIDGQRRPRLRKVIMEQGGYFDAETLETITSPSDIKGAVVDNDGNVVISEKESSEILLDSKGSVLRRMTGGLLGGVKGALGTLGSVYGLYGTAAIGAFNLSRKAVTGLQDKLKAVKDVYVKGESRPRLYGRLLKTGYYLDAKSGEPIFSVNDIKGEVLDNEGETVLSLADLKIGLVDRFGISIDAQGIAGYLFGIAKRVAGTGLNLAGKGVKVMGAYYKGLGQVTAAAAGSVIDRFKGVKPATVKGGLEDISPLTERQDTQIALMESMLAWMEGAPANDDQIPDDNVVPFAQPKTVSTTVAESKESFKTAAVGNTALDMTGPIDLLLDRQPQGPLTDEGPTADEIITGDDTVSDVSSKGYQSAMLDTLRDIRGPKIAGDLDGDGDRDGGWRDILQRRKAEKEAFDLSDKGIKENDKKAEEKDGNTFGMLGGLLGGLGTIISNGFSGLSNVIMALIAGKGVKDLFGGGPDVDIDSKSKGGKTGKGKPGVVRKLLGKGANLIKSTGGLLGTGARVAGTAIAGTALGGTVLGGLTTAGSAIGGAVASGAAAVAAAPLALVIGSAVAVGAVGYGIYKGIQYFSRTADLEPLESLRYLEYGAPLNHEDFIYNLRVLEGEVLSDISWSDGIPSLDEKGVSYYEDLAEDWGLSRENPDDAVRWTGWFNNRFIPVLLTHLSVLNEIDGGFFGSDLDDIDDDLDDDKKATFINRTRFTERDNQQGLNPYQYMVSPMRGVPIASSAAMIAAYAQRILASLKTESLDDFDIETAMSKLKPVVAATATVKADSQLMPVPTVKTSDLEKGKKPVPAPSSMAKIGGIIKAMTLPTVVMAEKAYDLFSNWDRIEPLEALRYMEYGVPLNDTAFIDVVRDLEAAFIDAVEWSGNVPRLGVKNNELLAEVADEMGMDLSDPADVTELSTWFVRRFKPIMLTHLSALRRLDDEVDLDDIDDDLDTSLKSSFIAGTRFTEQDKAQGLNPYSWTASPMKGASVLENQAKIKSYTRRLLDSIARSDLDDFDIETIIPEAATVKGEGVSNATVNDNTGLINRTQEQLVQATKATAQTVGLIPPSPIKVDEALPKVAGKIPTGNTVLSSPTEGRLSSNWGLRVHPVTGKVKGHKGLDYAAPRGTPIYAASDGTIGRQYVSNSYGKVVYLFHPDGRSTRYAHMSAFGPRRQGDTVEQGDLLGYVGSTGRSTGNHLHFEYRDGQAQNAKPLDPTPFFTSAEKRNVKLAVKEAEDFASAEKAAVNTSEPVMEGENTLTGLNQQDTPALAAIETETSIVTGSTEAMVYNPGEQPLAGGSPVTSTAPSTITATAVKDSGVDLLLTEQTKQSLTAEEQRRAQIALQESTVARMDKLIQVMESSQLSDNSAMTEVKTSMETIAATQVKTKPTRQVNPPRQWPKTKTTGVVSLES